MSGARVFDPVQCDLGEGPLWHPERGQLYWFDINQHRLMTRTEDGATHWQFDEFVSAAGWVSRDLLLVASETRLLTFDVETGTRQDICPLEADTPETRCNDGRADPQGGFWIGTMGKDKEPGKGAIYRYYRGELRQLFAPISISNAICFPPDGNSAYFTDTPTGTIWKVRLDAQGWPDGEPETFLQLPADTHRPDGAVVDADGNLWCAQYGHGKVCVFSPSGEEMASHPLPASRTTCPAFGGPDLTTLFVTTATQQMQSPTPADGQTYALPVGGQGQTEHQVIL